MAEVFDFGLQEHKIKMDGGFSNNGLFAVVGDTARRLEVQLLNSNNAIQDTTGINLRLNAEVAGKLTFVDAVVKDATKGVYTVNLSNGMFLEPGNWDFQWQITKGASKISSFPFAVKIGENISEGGVQATNFYFNVEELRLKTVELENRYQAMIDSTTGKDVISAPEIIAARSGEIDLNTRLTKNEQSTTAQLAQKPSYAESRLKVDKIVPEDFSQSAHDYVTGGTVNLLSTPKNDSVSVEKFKNNPIIPEVTSFIKVGKNKFNVEYRSVLGEWCNYTTGVIQSTGPSTTFFRSYPYPVTGGETYARKYGRDGTVFFDSSMEFISGTQENTYTVPTNAKWVIYNFQNHHMDEQVELGEVSTETENYKPSIGYLNVNYGTFDQPIINNPTFTNLKVPLNTNTITIGTGGDFATVTEGLEYAYQNDKEVIILPGVYDLVAEGADLSTNGLNVPKKVSGYGATITANLPTENWKFSPLMIAYGSDKNAEICGLTVICSNCRYCIHDDLGSFKNYYNKYKDCTFINNSVKSDVLIEPRAIGGGTGSNGFVDIDSCILSSNTDADIDYHSDWQGTQTSDTIVKCTNSIFKTTIKATSIGDDDSFENKLYVSNCLLGTPPLTNTPVNFKMTGWNNVIKA